MQSTAPHGLLERWKTFVATKVDWWFAYTASTVHLLGGMGFPAERTTCLNNAVDVTGFKRELDAVDEAALAAYRRALGFAAPAPVALYCGSLYQEKRIDLLIEVARRVRALLPDFQLLVVGDGPLMPQLRQQGATLPWVHVLGPKRGGEKAVLHRMSTLLLCPGALGLQVLDSFAAALPIVTFATSLHGPEFAYVENGTNSLVLSEEDSAAMAQATVDLLTDDRRLAAMRSNCRVASTRYTLEAMVANFADGIERCLMHDAMPLGTRT